MTPIQIKLVAYLAAIMFALTLVGGGLTYVFHLRHALAAAQSAAATNKAAGAVAVAQTAATVSAATIADIGARRDALSITLHEANDHALQIAPGADASVDPALNAAGRRGLCGYASYAGDPGCAGLRVSGPDKLPAAGPGGATAGG